MNWSKVIAAIATRQRMVTNESNNPPMNAIDITVEYLPWLTAVVGVVLLIGIRSKAVAVGAFAVFTTIAVMVYYTVAKAQHDRDLTRVAIEVKYDTGQCGPDTPLLVMIKNGSTRPATRIAWNIGAYMPKDNQNLVWYGVSGHEWEQPYSRDAPMAPNESSKECLPIPTLKTSLFPHTLEYRSIYKIVRFGD